jgi:hypothetical protein
VESRWRVNNARFVAVLARLLDQCVSSGPSSRSGNRPGADRAKHAGDRPHEGGAAFRFQQRRISEIIGFRECRLSEAMGVAVIEVDAIEFIPGNGGGAGVRLRKG